MKPVKRPAKDSHAIDPDEPVAPYDGRVATRYFSSVNGGPKQWYVLGCVYKDGNESAAFFAPSSAGLHLRSAWRAAHEASKLRKAVRWSTGWASKTQELKDLERVQEVNPADVSTLFDFFEHAMVAVMSSYAAVEAFCNQVIAELGSEPFSIERSATDTHGKKVREMVDVSLETVEKTVSTDEKLKRLVPKLLGSASPAGTCQLWEPYVELQRVRNSVTHFKRRDISSTDANAMAKPTVLYKLIQTEPYAFVEAAQNLIRHFASSKLQTHWLDDALMRRSE